MKTGIELDLERVDEVVSILFVRGYASDKLIEELCDRYDADETLVRQILGYEIK